MNDTYGIRLILQQRNHNAWNWNAFNLVELVALIARRELSFYCHHPPLTHSLTHHTQVLCSLQPTQYRQWYITDRQRRSPHVKISEKNNVLLWTVIRTDHEDHRIWKLSEKIVYVVLWTCCWIHLARMCPKSLHNDLPLHAACMRTTQRFGVGGQCKGMKWSYKPLSW
jgi:hypothetical protein